MNQGNSSNSQDSNNFQPGGPFNPAQFQTFTPSMFPVPPPIGMPMFPHMMSPMVPVMNAPPFQSNYPQGQGPLANRPAARGDNGLLQAPEPEGPEEHEASRYIKLNPAETAKYHEYWSQASDGAETLSGPLAVGFLSRATKVSKGQLRRVWDVADHRREGHLDRSQFFVALRLVALAQRGAELSVSGIRNFAGIQLIPKIEPPPPPSPPSPPPASSVPQVPPAQEVPAPLMQSGAKSATFSWIVPRIAVDRFDKFFADLAPAGIDMLDASRVVPFLTKSGLPRPTLKKVWQLADVTADGMLSRDEFRIAMHLVTALRNKRVDVQELPEALDPSGPHWLRVEGEPQRLSNNHTDPGGSGTVDSPSLSVSSPIVPLPPPPPTAGLNSYEAGNTALPLASQQHETVSPMPSDGAQSTSPPLPPKAPLPDFEAEQAERQQMLEYMRKEREEMERTRIEMEAMRVEMERLRLEKENMLAAQATVSTPSPSFGGNQASSAASASSSMPSSIVSASATHIAPSTTITSLPQSSPLITNAKNLPTASETTSASIVTEPSVMISTAEPIIPVSTSTLTTPFSANEPVRAPATSAVPAILAQRLGIPIESTTANVQKSPTISKLVPAADEGQPENVHSMSANPGSIDNGNDEEDIWDQPSPKAGAVPTISTALAEKSDIENGDTENSSDEDVDDDFWGGMGPKPTLGAAGSRQPTATGSSAPSAKGFGGSELDDWAF